MRTILTLAIFTLLCCATARADEPARAVTVEPRTTGVTVLNNAAQAPPLPGQRREGDLLRPGLRPRPQPAATPAPEPPKPPPPAASAEPRVREREHHDRVERQRPDREAGDRHRRDSERHRRP